LGQIIVDDQDVVALVHPVLGESSASEWCKPLEACSIGSGCSHDGGVLESALLLEGLTQGCNGGALLTDCDVDAANLLGLVAGLPVGLLVKDVIDTDCGLASLTVTNDQLTLTAADWGHCIDSLDAGCQRLLDRLALKHGWCLKLE